MTLSTSRAVFYVVVIVLSLVLLFPLYVLFLIAFTPASDTVLATLPTLVPGGFTLQNLVNAFQGTDLVDPAVKSLETAFLVGGLSLALGVPAAYGLSKMRPNVANTISTLLFTVNMLPGLVIAEPISVSFIRFHLFDTVQGLALAQELVVLPLTIFLLLGAFQALPKDLENQARVDGAGMLRTLFTVLIPLTRAAVATAFLLSWMLSWDEFTFAVYLSPVHQTLPIVIYTNLSRGDVLASAAFALIVTVPVVVLTAILQRYLKGEYLAGGMHG